MTSHYRWRRPLALIAAGVALVLAGCSVESDDPPASSSPTSDAFPAPPAPATAPGVTADSIKIGFVYPDLEVVRQYVDIDHGDYQATFKALVDKVNAAGGINGRRIIPVYGAVDVISPAGAQETCVKLTQDEKVFAVLGSLNAEDAMCYVQTHRTALVGGDLTAERYAKAQAPWVSDLRGGDELADGIEQFTADNALAGKKLAVVAYRDDQASVDKVVLPALKRLQIPVTETGILDADISDAAAVSQQFNVFIQKFRAAGVDTVLLVGGSQLQFPAELQKTDYRPRLMFAGTSQAGAYLASPGEHDPAIMAGATALGLVVDYREPVNAACVATLEAALPALRGKLVDPATVPSGQPSPGTSESAACRYLTLFQAIAEKAGKDLTYQSFQQAAFSLGSLQVPTYRDKATYGRETPHGAIPPRLFAFDPAKKNFFPAAG
ncbi:ABC transporter substrate-binding protein [Parafrankia discariae]|uniref:ABC transporter substrate-binding protein n=1 Tax=Parafrankia discariae TaxID=365528 RepID=UPI00037B3D5E|nr:ABC transporter substrate-binding protein [Parafrankia discariae]